MSQSNPSAKTPPSEDDQQPDDVSKNLVHKSINQSPSQHEAVLDKSKAITEQAPSHTLRDLLAQETMAEAAIWMAAAAVLTLFITSMGTLLIWRQVKLTRQAVEDTSDATEAMREANVIARTIGRVQTRAYLSIQGLVGETFDNGLVFTATVKNCGQSPALSAQIMLEIVQGDGTIITVLPEHEHQIAAQGIAEMAKCYYKSEPAETLGSIVVKATVVYADVFLEMHKTRETFADSPCDWKNGENPLTKGMHVASYIRAMNPD